MRDGEERKRERVNWEIMKDAGEEKIFIGYKLASKLIKIYILHVYPLVV